MNCHTTKLHNQMSRYMPADHKEHNSYTKLYNFPNNSHPVVQPPVMCGPSTIPLRLPKQSSQRTEFSFVGKSGKADAFSFVQDEMKARK